MHKKEDLEKKLFSNNLIKLKVTNSHEFVESESGQALPLFCEDCHSRDMVTHFQTSLANYYHQENTIEAILFTDEIITVCNRCGGHKTYIAPDPEQHPAGNC